MIPTLFPHLSSKGTPPSPEEVLARIQSTFYARVAAGELKPLVLPHLLYGFIPVLMYLCIPHTTRPWLYKARWAVLVGVLWWQVKLMRETGSRSVANGFAVGLVSAWGMVWATTWLVCERPQWDGKRVRRRKRTVMIKKPEAQLDIANANGRDTQSNGSTQESHLQHRRPSNGHASLTNTNNGYARLTATFSDGVDADKDEWEYFWQPYPLNLSDRIPWLLDLLITFRLPGWNYAIPPLPPISTKYKSRTGEPLYPSPPRSSSRDILNSFQTRRELAKYRIPRFIAGYFLLDLIKVTMMHDPYFLFGPTTYALPAHLASLPPWALHLLRQVLGGAGIIIAIHLIFSLPPVLTLLVPSSIPLPLILTPPYYPSTWGSSSALLNQGLAGLWGTWWHQTFRFGFSAPYDWALREGIIKPRTTTARLFSLLCAFGISSFLHASGSFTEVSHTKPLDAFLFFLSQAVGIVVQGVLSQLLKSLVTTPSPWMRKVGNVLFICAWLHWTCDWLVDDFSRCGIWLFEPLPLSFFRGIGFGVSGRAGWGEFWLGKRWEPVDLHWYRGEHWWEYGLAI